MRLGAQLRETRRDDRRKWSTKNINKNVGREQVPFKILTVCTGNICRSPSAEAVLRERLAEAGLAGRAMVDSAGTADYHIGEPPSERSAERRGGPGRGMTGKARW